MFKRRSRNPLPSALALAGGMLCCAPALAAPAAGDPEQQAFPAPPAIAAKAQGLIGVSCTNINYLNALRPDAVPKTLAGFAAAPKSGFVLLEQGTVFVLQQDGARFAFLFSAPEPGGAPCTITDAVSLPPKGALLACSIDADTGVRPQSSGIGVEGDRSHKTQAYWDADPDSGHFSLPPLRALGWASKLHCTPAEGGE
ncbi:hypothetical protein ACFO0J_13225 [Castellaniella hirudinis]|uniref:Uncharacterized protein n=1 Tax=Castellaniella hirudinis TaxID=1144617 RepID=A0ABV8S1P9_9BURK